MMNGLLYRASILSDDAANTAARLPLPGDSCYDAENSTFT
jgi:hypothetical protein